MCPGVAIGWRRAGDGVQSLQDARERANDLWPDAAVCCAVGRVVEGPPYIEALAVREDGQWRDATRTVTYGEQMRRQYVTWERDADGERFNRRQWGSFEAAREAIRVEGGQLVDVTGRG